MIQCLPELSRKGQRPELWKHTGTSSHSTQSWGAQGSHQQPDYPLPGCGEMGNLSALIVLLCKVKIILHTMQWG